MKFKNKKKENERKKGEKYQDSGKYEPSGVKFKGGRKLGEIIFKKIIIFIKNKGHTMNVLEISSRKAS